MNRAKFYDSIRDSLFNDTLNAAQVQGMEIILNTWDSYKFTDVRWLAYMLGTTYLETGHSMQPIKEAGGASYLTKMYDVTGSRPTLAKKMGNTKHGDGILYCGRGFVQLTWKSNYAKMGKILDLDLIKNPDLAMLPDNAAKIMFEGMTKSESGIGDFTGVGLEAYFNAKTENWIGARAIINGSDRAVEIGSMSRKFLAGIKAGS